MGRSGDEDVFADTGRRCVWTRASGSKMAAISCGTRGLIQNVRLAGRRIRECAVAIDADASVWAQRWRGRRGSCAAAQTSGLRADELTMECLYV